MIYWKTLFMIALGIMAGLHLSYRLHHPEMTETQLLLNFFEIFKVW